MEDSKKCVSIEIVSHDESNVAKATFLDENSEMLGMQTASYLIDKRLDFEMSAMLAVAIYFGESVTAGGEALKVHFKRLGTKVLLKILNQSKKLEFSYDKPLAYDEDGYAIWNLQLWCPSMEGTNLFLTGDKDYSDKQYITQEFDSKENAVRYIKHMSALIEKLNV